MIREVQLRLTPEQSAQDPDLLRKEASAKPSRSICQSGVGQAQYRRTPETGNAATGGPCLKKKRCRITPLHLPDLSSTDAPEVHIIGCGPQVFLH